MLQTIRTVLKSNFTLASAYYLVSDRAIRVAFKLGHIDTNSGVVHDRLPVSDSIEYIERVFADYKRYGGVSRFSGRVAEIGPGDNCGVGLLFKADGCDHVDLVDRFYSKRDTQVHARVYEALRERHSGLEESLKNADLRDETTFPGVQRRYGASAAAEEFFVAHKGYDVIASRAVFEHLYDPLLALRRMSEALNPGGLLLHQIDLRDHGMFTPHFHELKFLEIPDWLYPLMTTASGRPNRILVHDYRRVLAECGVAAEILVTRLAGVGPIEPYVPYEQIAQGQRDAARTFVARHRARFATSFVDASDADLSVTGIFLVARKT